MLAFGERRGTLSGLSELMTVTGASRESVCLAAVFLFPGIFGVFVEDSPKAPCWRGHCIVSDTFKAQRHKVSKFITQLEFTMLNLRDLAIETRSLNTLESKNTRGGSFITTPFTRARKCIPPVEVCPPPTPECPDPINKRSRQAPDGWYGYMMSFG